MWRAEPPYHGVVYMDAPTYSHDGASIFFLGSHEDGRQGLWSVAADGGEPSLVVVADDPSLWIKHAFISAGDDYVYLTINEYESDIWVVDLIVN